MARKKWTRTGWIGQRETRDTPFHEDPDMGSEMVILFPRKGSPRQWCPGDRPPVKVRVTVEVLE